MTFAQFAIGWLALVALAAAALRRRWNCHPEDEQLPPCEQTLKFTPQEDVVTLEEELAQVAGGVQEQVAAQLKPGVRCMVIISAPDGRFAVANNYERPRLIKVLERALDSARGGAKSAPGLLWLPPGVRA